MFVRRSDIDEGLYIHFPFRENAACVYCVGIRTSEVLNLVTSIHCDLNVDTGRSIAKYILI